jgi:hypothetical protein
LDIDDWLRGIGLAQYAEAFRANDIDVSVLRHLTDVDLEKLGVSLGHRRKILVRLRNSPVPFRYRRSPRCTRQSPKTPPSAGKSR